MNKRNLLELRDSIRRRGFWVNIIDGELVLDSWYSQRNFDELVDVLSQFPLSFEFGKKGIRVNADSFPSGLLEQIETISRRDMKYTGLNLRRDIPFLWKNYGRYDCFRRHDITILELDYGIAALVFALNKVGFQTAMSCDGHGRKEANIWFNHREYMEELSRLLL